MTRTSKPRIGLAALALAGLGALSACGGGSDPDARVASLASDDGAASTTTVAADKANNEDVQQAMLDFAKCMREHGVDMPDPTFGDDGGTFTAGAKVGDGNDIDRTKLDEAQKACQHFMDAV